MKINGTNSEVSQQKRDAFSASTERSKFGLSKPKKCFTEVVRDVCYLDALDSGLIDLALKTRNSQKAHAFYASFKESYSSFSLWHELEDYHRSYIRKKREELQLLGQGFNLVNPTKIFPFLEKHPGLASLLNKVAKEIRSFFQNESLLLEYSVDPEVSSWEKLWVKVSVDSSDELKVEEAIRKLDEFDKSWWLDASLEANALLSIDIEFQ